MDTKRFILVMSLLTAVFTVAAVVYNFASEPPFAFFSQSAAAADVELDSATVSAEFAALFEGESSPTPAALSAAVPSSSSSFSSPSPSPAASSAVAAVSSKAVLPSASSSGKSSSKKRSSSHAASSAAVHFPININTASAEELTALPGIGDVIAQRIVEYRQQKGAFKSLADLDNVKGIGSKKLEKIKDDVTFQ